MSRGIHGLLRHSARDVILVENHGDNGLRHRFLACQGLVPFSRHTLGRLTPPDEASTCHGAASAGLRDSCGTPQWQSPP